jgi:hypothetical protein
MLISLLGYVLTGLVLALPLWHGLRWLATRFGLFGAPAAYLRPYQPVAQRQVSPEPEPGSGANQEEIAP